MRVACSLYMTFADKLSVLRIILVPIFVSLLISSSTHPSCRYFAIGIFLLAVLSDFFDGLVARIKKEKSQIGQVIDPLADKLLLFTAVIALYLLPQFSIPRVFVLVVVSRDLVILLGIALLFFMKIDVPISPSIWGKLTTFFQMLTILCVLFNFKFSNWVWHTAIVFTLISGIQYVSRGVAALNKKAGEESCPRES